MTYMLIVMEPRGQREARTDEEGRAVYARMVECSSRLAARGVLRASQSLLADRTGTRVEVRDGKRTLKDGPFSESKEMIGGYFIVDCATRDEAVQIASELPAAEWATIEVREFGPCFA